MKETAAKMSDVSNALAEAKRYADGISGGGSGSSVPAIKCTTEGTNISISDSSEAPLSGLRVFGKTTQKTTTGKNLYGGGDVECVVSKSVVFNHGIPEGTYMISAIVESNDTDADNCLILIYNKNNEKITTGFLARSANRTSAMFKIPEGKEAYKITFYASNNYDFSVGDTATFKDVQIEAGTTATYYEPYTGGIPSPSPKYSQQMISVGDNGNIEVSVRGENPDDTARTLTLSTPTGLPGIPVSSGGNYTDENGQQWVCDEIDLARGKYVQRIWKKVLNGSENWGIYESSSGFSSPVFSESMNTRDGLSDQLRIVKSSAYAFRDSAILGANNAFIYICKSSFYDESIGDKGLANWKAHLREHPMTIMSYLKNPVETDLSAEEIAAFKALHTNKPVTNITNDEGAHMEVEYTADTKSYIQNNYVPKATYDALETRVAALEQQAIS